MNNIILSAFADEAGDNFNDQITALKQNGLNALEIRGVNGKNVTELTTDEVKEVKKKLEQNGLYTWSIGSPIGKIKLTDNFNNHLELFKKTLETADILGAKYFRLFSFFMEGDNAYESSKQQVFCNMQKFVDAARNSDVVLCHENEKGIYGDKAARCLEIHKEFKTIKAVFDPANFVQCGQDTVEAWKMLHPFVEYMHIKDAFKSGAVVPAGKGDGNVEYLINKYLENGGTEFTLEPHLSNFSGLKGLELEQKRSEVGGYLYANQREAFDAAVTALKDLLNK